MTTPTTELLAKDEVRSLFMANGFTIKEGQTDLKPYVYAAYDAIERALLARLGEQQPVAWAVGLPGEPIKQQALWSTEPSADDVRFATTQGGLPLPALVVTPLYTRPSPAPVGAQEREAFEAWFKVAVHDRLCRNMPDGSYNCPSANAAWQTWQAARSAAQGAVQVPAGWQLVPVEPTLEMLTAYVNTEGGPRKEWAAMLAAAPAHAGERSEGGA